MALLAETLRGWFLRTMIPVTQWIGRQHWPIKHHRITENDFAAVKAVLKPGMVFCTRRTGELNNLFIPGFWTHAAIYVGDGQVVEAITEGVSLTPLDEFLCGRSDGKDYVLVRDALYLTDDEKQVAVDFAKKQVGLPYDWVFAGTDDRAFYCSKLVWFAFETAYRQSHRTDSPFVLQETLGVDTVTPEDIAEAHDKWKTIYVSAGVPSDENPGALWGR